MKNFKRIIALALVALICTCMLSSCGEEVKYEAHTRFLYSVDGGNTFKETLQEVPVNSTYYLAVEMQVVQSAETDKEMVTVATITIPNTNVVDVYLDDHPGVTVNGTTNTLDNSISYKFNVVAGTSPSKFRVVFECKPLAEGKASILVQYDDLVSESWDATGTIKYVTVENE